MPINATDNAVVNAFIIDHSAVVREALCRLLDGYGVPVKAYESAAAFVSAEPKLAGPCLVVDEDMPLQTAPALLETEQGPIPSAPVTVIACEATLRTFRTGVVSYLKQPMSSDRFLEILRHAPPQQR